MAGTSAYATPISMPLIAKAPLKTKMSKEAKEHYDYMLSREVELFEDEETGELYSKVTDINTGECRIRKCEYTDED